MNDRRLMWAVTGMTALAALFLAGCSGSLPLPQAAEVAEATGSELEFTAPVDGIGPDTWSVGGLAVTVLAETEVSGSPRVGDLVRIQALLSPQGLMARQIEIVQPAAQPQPETVPASGGEELEFFGAVASISTDAWVVGDRTVSLTSETEIKGAIAVGDMVKVHASPNADQTLTAREIELATPEELAEAGDDLEDDDQGEGEDDDDLEFKGVVEAIDGETWTVGGMTFQVPLDAEIRDAIAVGDFVEIHAVWSVDGVLTAVRIELEDNDVDEADDDQDDLDDDDDADDEDDEDEDEDDDEDDEHEDEQDDDDDNSGSGSSGSG